MPMRDWKPITPEHSIEIVEDDAGLWHWKLLGLDGEVIDQLHQGVADRAAAEQDAQRAFPSVPIT